MSERKRKRDEESHSERPKKKATTDATSTGIAKVSVVQEVGEWTPVIASTPGLSLPAQISFKPYTKSKVHSRAQLPVSSKLLLHSSDHPTVDYTAQEESNIQGNLLNHYIGIYDPQNEQLKLISARGVTVRRTLRQDAAEESSQKEADPPQNAFSTRSALGLEFGTKKSQKAIRSRTENAIGGKSAAGSSRVSTLDPAASFILESMAADVTSVLTRENMQNEAAQAKPIPKPNLNAESPADVYPIERLVGALAFRKLQVCDWKDKVEAGEEITTKSKFVSDRITKVVKKGNEKLLKALKYMLLLLEWYYCLGDGRRRGRVPKSEDVAKAIGWASSDLLEDLSKRFSEGSNLSKWHINYLLTHICALALTIDAFKIVVNDLSADLRLDIKEIKTLYRELGCHVSHPPKSEPPGPSTSAKGKQKQKEKGGATSEHLLLIAKLKLPLTFPQLRALTNRGKGRR